MSQEKKEEVNTSLKKLVDLLDERLEQHNSNREEVIDKLKEICSENIKKLMIRRLRGIRKLQSMMMK